MSYIKNKDKLKAKGVDQVVFIASNDHWVMSAWGKANGVKDDYIVSGSSSFPCPSTVQTRPRAQDGGLTMWPDLRLGQRAGVQQEHRLDPGRPDAEVRHRGRPWKGHLRGQGYSAGLHSEQRC